MAAIVSAVSIGGVLVTDIVSNVAGGYISDQIKATWSVPAATRRAAGPRPADCGDGREHPHGPSGATRQKDERDGGAA